MPTFDEMLDAEIARREAGQGGQPQASPSSFDPTMMMMEGMDAAEQHRQRRMDAMQAPQGPSQAGISPVMPGRAPQPEMRPQAPPPSATGAPPIPSPVGMPMSLAQYGTETVRNLPGSIQGVGEDLWGAVTDPVGTMQGVGETVLGAAQLGKDYAGIPSTEMLGDFRDQARAAGEHLQRYGPERIGQTFRRDPAGTALDVGGLAVPGAAAGARAASMGAKFGRHIADIDAPPPKTRTTVPTDREFIAGAPSKEGLHKHGSMLYKAADDAGVRFEGPAYTEFVDRLSTKLMSEGLDDVLYPKTSRINKIMTETVGTNPSLQELNTLRRQYGDAAESPDPSERRLGKMGRDAVDRFVESSDSATGSVLKEARQTWGQMRKTEVIERAIAKGKKAKAGVESGLRAEFAKLYRAHIDGNKKMRGFSDAEMKAIGAVADGNMSANVLARIGSLSGGTGSQRNMLNLMAGGGLGYGAGTMIGGPLIGGPLGAGAVAGGANLAQRLAQRGTQQRADMARAVTARGETPEQVAVPTTRSGRAPRAAAMGALPLAALLAGPERRGR